MRGGGEYRWVILRPIVIDTSSDISEIVGTGKVPDHSRMLARATAYSQGSSSKSCVALRIFRTFPNMKLRRKEN